MDEQKGIKFYNIRTGESRVAIGEPHIAAFWSSSDKSPNITQGQDFGWRLAPETQVELDRIKQNPKELSEIANRYQKDMESVNESDILQWIVEQKSEKTGQSNSDQDFKEYYKEEIKKIEEQIKAQKELEEQEEQAQSEESENVTIENKDKRLEDYKRSTLEVIAEDEGVESPSEFKNKEALIEAIKVKRGE